MSSTFFASAVACFSVLSLSGCVMGPDFQAPDNPLASRWAPTPNEAGHSGTNESSVDVRWWDSFADAQLSALVREAQTRNFDLQLAASRLEQSRAMRRQVAAEELPAVDGAREKGLRVLGCLSKPVTVCHLGRLLDSYEQSVTSEEAERTN